MDKKELIATALDLYEQGVPVIEITEETGLQKKEYAEFITKETDKIRKQNKGIVSSSFPEEWDKARFKLLGKNQ